MNYIIKTFYLSFFLIVLSSILSCESKTEELDESKLGYQYYPIEIGNEWIYAVDSMVFASNGTVRDTVHWFIRERITESIELKETEEKFKLERSKSKDNVSWVIADIWTITKTDVNIQKNEENHNYIKLIFPPELGKRWDGNAFIDENDEIVIYGEIYEIFRYWDYKIEETLDYISIQNNDYENILKVREVLDTTNISHKSSYTYYAESIGLVKEEKAFLFDNTSMASNAPWADKVDYGFIISKELINYSIK